MTKVNYNKKELEEMRDMYQELDALFNEWLKLSHYTKEDFIEKFRKCKKFKVVKEEAAGEIQNMYMICKDEEEPDSMIQIGANFALEPNGDVELFKNQAWSIIYKIATELDLANATINDSGSWEAHHFQERVKKYIN